MKSASYLISVDVIDSFCAYY